MMSAQPAVRLFHRDNDGITIWIGIEGWPSHIPNPAGIAIARTGEGEFLPYWKLYLLPDKTIELLVGWFVSPLSMEETNSWYHAKLDEQGWVEKKRSTLPDSVLVHLEHPTISARMELNIRHNTHIGETRVVIQQSAEHSWSFAETGQARSVDSDDRSHISDESAT